MPASSSCSNQPEYWLVAWNYAVPFTTRRRILSSDHKKIKEFAASRRGKAITCAQLFDNGPNFCINLAGDYRRLNFCVANNAGKLCFCPFIITSHGVVQSDTNRLAGGTFIVLTATDQNPALMKWLGTARPIGTTHEIFSEVTYGICFATSVLNCECKPLPMLEVLKTFTSLRDSKLMHSAWAAVLHSDIFTDSFVLIHTQHSWRCTILQMLSHKSTP